MNVCVVLLLKSLRDDMRDMPSSNWRGALDRWNRLAVSKIDAALILAQSERTGA